MIMSLGTYSWWAANLISERGGGGEVVYFGQEFNMRHSENMIHPSLVEEFGEGSKINKADYYKEGWIEM